MKETWPASLPAAQVRIARPTNRLEEVIRFYHEGIGLNVIGSFENHAGYSGVMLGLPGHEYHLEFTSNDGSTNLPPPSKDNLIVFYIPDHQTIIELTERLHALGFNPVAPENPYWEEKGTTFEDPDGYRVVLMNTNGI